MNFVETKVEAVFVCEHRPLRDGEKPKRRGQTTMFEGTGEINAKFIEKITDPLLSYKVTIKHDGSCSKITIRKELMEDGNEKVICQIFKRYDTREGNLPKEGGVPGGYNESGGVDFYWIDVTQSVNPDDQWYQSTLVRDVDGNIFAINMIVVNEESGYEIKAVPVEEIETGTYEILGPKIQANFYGLPLDSVTTISVLKKGVLYKVEVPLHYFIRHGSFEVKDVNFTVENITLDSIREYILSHIYEGLVFHFSDGTLMKVNRGHIGVEVDKETPLRLI